MPRRGTSGRVVGRRSGLNCPPLPSPPTTSSSSSGSPLPIASTSGKAARAERSCAATFWSSKRDVERAAVGDAADPQPARARVDPQRGYLLGDARRPVGLPQRELDVTHVELQRHADVGRLALGRAAVDAVRTLVQQPSEDGMLSVREVETVERVEGLIPSLAEEATGVGEELVDPVLLVLLLVAVVGGGEVAVQQNLGDRQRAFEGRKLRRHLLRRLAVHPSRLEPLRIRQTYRFRSSARRFSSAAQSKRGRSS